MSIRSSDTVGKLAEALSTVQAELYGVAKTAKGHGYKYAPLDEVTKLVNPRLSAAGLSYVQMPGEETLITRLMHTSGEWIEASMTLAVPKLQRGNDAQAYGAALTYARRYALTSMLGIAADEDTDAVSPPPMQGAPEPVRQPATNGSRPQNGTEPPHFTERIEASTSTIQALSHIGPINEQLQAGPHRTNALAMAFIKACDLAKSDTDVDSIRTAYGAHVSKLGKREDDVKAKAKEAAGRVANESPESSETETEAA